MDENHINSKEIEGQINLFSKKAESVVSDENKLRSLVNRAKKWLGKGKAIPVIGDVIDDLVTMIDLLSDYVEGTYRKIPLRILISIVAAILYVLSPIDLIPDYIPVIGYLDDVAVITFVLGTGAAAELKKYKKWKEEQERQNTIETIKTKIQELLLDCKENERIVAVFAVDDTTIEILCSNEECIEKPIECHSRVLNIADLQLDSTVICDLVGEAVDHLDLRWSPFGKIKVQYEQEYSSFESDFIVLGDDE